jgi:hypothetical protein
MPATSLGKYITDVYDERRRNSPDDTPDLRNPLGYILTRLKEECGNDLNKRHTMTYRKRDAPNSGEWKTVEVNIPKGKDGGAFDLVEEVLMPGYIRSEEELDLFLEMIKRKYRDAFDEVVRQHGWFEGYKKKLVDKLLQLPGKMMSAKAYDDADKLYDAWESKGFFDELKSRAAKAKPLNFIHDSFDEDQFIDNDKKYPRLNAHNQQLIKHYSLRPSDLCASPFMAQFCGFTPATDDKNYAPGFGSQFPRDRLVRIENGHRRYEDFMFPLRDDQGILSGFGSKRYAQPQKDNVADELIPASVDCLLQNSAVQGICIDGLGMRKSSVTEPGSGTLMASDAQDMDKNIADRRVILCISSGSEDNKDLTREIAKFHGALDNITRDLRQGRNAKNTQSNAKRHTDLLPWVVFMNRGSKVQAVGLLTPDDKDHLCVLHPLFNSNKTIKANKMATRSRSDSNSPRNLTDQEISDMFEERFMGVDANMMSSMSSKMPGVKRFMNDNDITEERYTQWWEKTTGQKVGGAKLANLEKLSMDLYALSRGSPVFAKFEGDFGRVENVLVAGKYNNRDNLVTPYIQSNLDANALLSSKQLVGWISADTHIVASEQDNERAIEACQQYFIPGSPPSMVPRRKGVRANVRNTTPLDPTGFTPS